MSTENNDSNLSIEEIMFHGCHMDETVCIPADEFFRLIEKPADDFNPINK